MKEHKRVLAILFIISGSLEILFMLLLRTLFSTLFMFLADEAGEEGRWVFEWLLPFLQYLAIGVICIIAIPSIIGGIAVLNEKKWGLTLLLVMGCLGIFSFPIGTALGIYTIWVYSKDKKEPTA